MNEKKITVSKIPVVAHAIYSAQLLQDYSIMHDRHFKAVLPSFLAYKQNT